MTSSSRGSTPEMSRPAQNARPSPRSTSARTSPACVIRSASPYASESWAMPAGSSALSLSGAFSTTSATPSATVSSIMMLRSAGRHRPVRRVPGSDVVVDDDAVGLRVRLAREHVAAFELVGFERVVLGHRHVALDAVGGVGREELVAHVLHGYGCRSERVAGELHELERTAEEPLVDRCRRDQHLEHALALFRGDAPREERPGAPPPREPVKQ